MAELCMMQDRSPPRAVDLLRDLDSADGAVGLQPPAEAAADQMIVHHHLL
jgi:hypothetical protein